MKKIQVILIFTICLLITNSNVSAKKDLNLKKDRDDVNEILEQNEELLNDMEMGETIILPNRERSGSTYSKVKFLYEVQGSYSFLGYHPQTRIWKSRRAQYILHTGSSLPFSVSVGAFGFGISIDGIANSGYGYTANLKPDVAKKLRSGNYSSRVGVYGKPCTLKYKVEYYYTYSTIKKPYKTVKSNINITRDENDNYGEVDYEVVIKKTK